jgi:hypothetical protein
MAFTPTISTDLASQLVTVYANAALQPLVSVLKMGAMVNRFYEGSFGEVGQTLNVPLPPVFTANDLAETGTVTTQENQLTTAPLTIGYHKEASFGIPQVTQSFTNIDLGVTYVRSAVVAVAQAVEQDLLNLYTGFTSNTACGTGGTTLTDAVMRDARKALVKAKVPDQVQKYLVVNPDAYEAILADSALTAQYAVGFPVGQDTPVQTGNIGQRYGLNIVEHQLVPQVTAGSPAVTTTNNILFAPDAIMLVTRRLPPIPAGLGAVSADMDFGNFVMRLTYSYKADNLAQQWTVSCLYGCAVLRPQFGVVVKS